MCTSSCQSSYDKAFTHLRGKVIISSNDSYYKQLLEKQNLSCVRTFLASIASKVR